MKNRVCNCQFLAVFLRTCGSFERRIHPAEREPELVAPMQAIICLAYREGAQALHSERGVPKATAKALSNRPRGWKA